MLRLFLGLALAALVVVLPGQGATGRAGLIAFERDSSIFVVNPDGSGLRPLAKKFGREPGEGDGYLDAPAFTPDGSEITYVNGGRTTHQSVVVRPARGGRPKLLPFEGTLLNSALSFSPDGRHAVVSRLTDPPQRAAIYVATTKRRNFGVQLTGTLPRKNFWDLSPDWSPDGRRIVFTRAVGDGPGRLIVLTRSGKAERGLGRGWQPDWSPDGQLIAFGREDGVYVCRPDGSALRRVVPASDPESPGFSPDGQQIAYVSEGSVWVVTIQGGPATKVADGATGALGWG